MHQMSIKVDATNKFLQRLLAVQKRGIEQQSDKRDLEQL